MASTGIGIMHKSNSAQSIFAETWPTVHAEAVHGEAVQKAAASILLPHLSPLALCQTPFAAEVAGGGRR